MADKNEDSLNFLGYDLYFDQNDLDLFADIGRDSKVVSGKGNLSQALKARLETMKGEIALHPTYGSDLPTLIGQPNDEVTRNMAVTLFSETINDEDRIDDVASVSVSTDSRNRNIVKLGATLNVRRITEPADVVYDFFL
jgi:phage baseplate assembly protein W